MAIEEQPREDLLREATAYSRRVLIAFPQHVSPNTSTSSGTQAKGLTNLRSELFAGIRPSGAWSFYFDEDPVIQLTESLKIRRLYWHHRKFIAEKKKLFELLRDARGGRVQLEKREVDSEAATQIVIDCQQRMSAAWHNLNHREFEVLGTVPIADDRIVSELASLLERLAAGIELA